MLEIRNDTPIASMTPEVTNIQPLRGEHEAEVIDFLSAHPLFTFAMTGFIKDNGLESELNRGRFYASRNGRGEVDGVALIGHVTLFETSSDIVLSAFANLTRKRSEEHTSELQSQSNLVCRLLLEKKKKIEDENRLHTAALNKI